MSKGAGEKTAGHHKSDADASAIRVATVTVSDTRTKSDDLGGAALREGLAGFGFTLEAHSIVSDERDAIERAVSHAVQAGAHAVVTTGGTGIAARDVTYEVVSAMLEKRLDGFGEAFRRLSWEQVGARSVLSRAVAGTYEGALVFALPGSPKAVTLAVKELVGPLLPHGVGLLRKGA